MLKNYIKIASRTVLKNKLVSSINITGLAVGMAVVMLIALWIYDELSFNKYHQNYREIVQVMQHQNFNGDIHTDKAIPIPLRTELGNIYGEDFKYLVLSSWTNPHTIGFKDKVLSRPGNFMESDAPGMLTLKLLKGSLSGLTEPGPFCSPVSGQNCF